MGFDVGGGSGGGGGGGGGLTELASDTVTVADGGFVNESLGAIDPATDLVLTLRLVDNPQGSVRVPVPGATTDNPFQIAYRIDQLSDGTADVVLQAGGSGGGDYRYTVYAASGA